MELVNFFDFIVSLLTSIFGFVYVLLKGVGSIWSHWYYNRDFSIGLCRIDLVTKDKKRYMISPGDGPNFFKKFFGKNKILFLGFYLFLRVLYMPQYSIKPTIKPKKKNITSSIFTSL